MIRIEKLVKEYEEVTALRDISLEIGDSEIFGLLGPNGSGKSTLMRILAGILHPSRGKVEINEIDPEKNEEKIKEIVGYVPESPNLYESLSPIELFEFLGSIRGISVDSLDIIDRFVEAFDIQDKINDDIGSLSFGMKQKISIIAAVLHNPEVLIMDESMNGLDPKSVRIMKEYLNSFSDKENTVIYSTHILEVAEKICDRVAIMRNGNVVSIGTVDELRDILKSESLEEVFFKVTEEEDFEPIIKGLEETM
ncbi:3-dehydroquinate dehydratase [candidate division MSBL1 archaeon SCGC-AAA382C18]|uniref:3-dehydroquinate dehydratase n=1 Tax=candidate division MSBL1 archaeon SCGC-AAA382C18 TaxID=1698281 RepID=A0A133VIV1_9EURY|nr:3-dehydroquinate dehydratase [candidate division MSBL1 archaeon SCGC-AAA382C18]